MNILTMNQNVFGSSFETTKRNNFTENAISSELIIPDSAVELSYEEMEYVDGGQQINNAVLGLMIDGALIVIGAAVAMYSAQASALISKGIRLFRGIYDKAINTLANIINSVAIYFGVPLFGAQLGLATIIGSALLLTPGMLIATVIDWAQDRKVDGYVRF